MTEEKKEWVEKKLAKLDEEYESGKRRIEERGSQLVRELEEKLKERERVLLNEIRKEK
ncbi:MAG: hypothetical protein QW039_02325 [Fervidicoccaceae archaeon]